MIVARTRVAHFIAVAVVVVFFSSCGGPIAIWVIPGSTADRLTFGFSESRKSKAKVKPGSIKVFPCSVVGRKPPGKSYFPSDDQAVWIATVPSEKYLHDQAKATNRITYGKDEFGLQTELGPKPLATPGCYVASVSASDDVSGNNTLFKIGADGVVRQVDDLNEIREVFK